MVELNDIEHSVATLVVTWQEQSPAELLTQTGEWLEGIGQDYQATVYYEAALAADPNYGLAAWRGGQLSLKNQNYKEAAQSFEKALQVEPLHAPTHYLASVAYFRLEDFGRALAFARSTLSLNPSHQGAFLQKLRCFGELKQWDELNTECRFLPINSASLNEPFLWCTLAALHSSNKKEALIHYEQVLPKTKKRFEKMVKEIEELLSIS